MNEATTAAYAAIKILDVMTTQHETVCQALMTLARVVERLENHVEKIEQHLNPETPE